MTYIVLTVLGLAIGVFAVVMLLRHELPPAEQLRVAWNPAPTPPAPFSLPLRFSGPDRYCPTCGRLLVKIHENGTFNLSGEASLEALGEITVENGVPIRDSVETLVVEAICLICEPKRDSR